MEPFQNIHQRKCLFVFDEVLYEPLDERVGANVRRFPDHVHF